MATKPVVLRELANLDIDEAIAYYLGEGAVDATLGLVDALEKAFDHIGQHPASGSTRYALELNLPELRSWPLTRYPYLVFYIENAEHVDVWRVLHAQRDIPMWMQGESDRL